MYSSEPAKEECSRRNTSSRPRTSAPVAQVDVRDGMARGVFALQLHGLEHFWPPTLMASGAAAVAAWLRQPVPATTERLPSHLQSRWVDAGTLPEGREVAYI